MRNVFGIFSMGFHIAKATGFDTMKVQKSAITNGGNLLYEKTGIV